MMRIKPPLVVAMAGRTAGITSRHLHQSCRRRSADKRLRFGDIALFNDGVQSHRS